MPSVREKGASRSSLQDLVLLFEPPVPTPQTGEFRCLGHLFGQRFGRASCQDLIAPAAQLVRMNAKLLGNRRCPLSDISLTSRFEQPELTGPSAQSGQRQIDRRSC